MNYRIHDKQKTITFGRWPELMLGEARERLRSPPIAGQGIDPVEHAKLEKVAQSLAASHIRGGGREWLDKITAEGAAPMTVKKARWLWRSSIRQWGDARSRNLAHELLLALKKIEATKRYNAASRARTAASQVFRYAIATARAERDIASDLRGALITPKTTHRAAITVPTEAGALLRTIDDYDGHPLTRTALRMLAHVFVRPGELRWAEWNEFDLEKRIWTIPGHKMKMRRPHMVPLSRQVIAIIEEIEHDRPSALCSSFPAIGGPADVRQHDQRRAAPIGLFQGRDDGARISRFGGHFAQ
jgi:integrase